MNLQEFKTANGITTLNFYKSHKSERYVASFGNNRLLITTVDFNRSEPAYVYDNPQDPNGKILSNKKAAEAVFSM